MKQWAQTIIWITIIFSLCVQSYSAQDPTSSIDNEHPIIFHKIAFTDDDSFDLFLEGILQSGYDNILILTELEYDGIKPPVIPPRLKAWIESYIEANKGKS
jgi:hypothetical protein